MTGALDQSVENLRLLCELLRVTNPMLESGAADLGRVAERVGQGEELLSAELEQLVAEMNALQEQAETSGVAVAKACIELSDAAEEVTSGGLAEMKTDATAAQSHWTAALQERSSELSAGFQELMSQGWEPLRACLTSELAEFERWIKAADEALQGLVLGVEAVATGLEEQGTAAEAAASDLQGSPALDDDFFLGTGVACVQLVQQIIPQFVDNIDSQGVELDQVHEQIVTAAERSSTNVRAQLDLTAETALNAIEAQADAMTKAVEAAEEALRNLQTEFERSAIQGEEADQEGNALVELAGQVVDAQAQLLKVREVLEALGQ